ncbi:post-GPI attachment to proteins factor 6 isoform X2 [Chiloscyllium plagiosum]|uniref:post-GPI attachment to proteins factor 6 isoform X2 n=1 Tax=Chiloscyllium plagiosum TaxID=36176 RepID=UPI001CB841AB|nr:post-GPI attachment to proteins factor 6 isoform X2 [Chiloscyllium plagiosum]
MVLLLTLLLLQCGLARAAGPTYISEYYSQTPQKLSLYSWYGNARLFVFQVPENTVLLKWILQASKGKGPECQNTNITVYFRAGAPPVINPLQTKFGIDTVVLPSFNLTIPLTSAVQSSTTLNISNPVSGDWFVAAHLPKDDGKIEVKGFSTKCSYIFQPQMLVQRLINVPVLEPSTSLALMLSSVDQVSHLKIFIPEHTVELTIHLKNCAVDTRPVESCPVFLLIGSNALPNSHLKIVNCSESLVCRETLDSPPWMKWMQLTVESSNPNWTITFEIEAYLTVCEPVNAGSFLTLFNNYTLSSNGTVIKNPDMLGVYVKPNNTELNSGGISCFRNQPVLREDVDVVSVRFFVLNGPDTPLTSEYPIILLLNLNTGRDNGGTIMLNLQLNKTSLSNENATVFACLSAGSPVMSLDVNSLSCGEALSWGYLLKMNSSVLSRSLQVPYPETDHWYLTLQILCSSHKSNQTCGKVSALVTVSAILNPCVGDCGVYGECRLLQTHGYLYAACVCKAGWNGWSCTDDTNAQSYSRQLLATLLLSLSNLMFIPPIVVAVHRYYFVEASVYFFTMFFSTFYHACDQPGIAVMCIMEYDTLQYCDFLGSVVSVWVTILCMARLRSLLKYVLFILGSLLIAMSMQLDRRGLWNLLGPCLVALCIMITAWVFRGVKRRHCYPPTWKRWVFFLLPGIGAALIAIAVYGFLETKENYYYTHSIWHILVAGSVVFLLPPGGLIAKTIEKSTSNQAIFTAGGVTGVASIQATGEYSLKALI